MRRWLCEPCDHKWWQHRHPDPTMRHLGLLLMVVGGSISAFGVYELVTL